MTSKLVLKQKSIRNLFGSKTDIFGEKNKISILEYMNDERAVGNGIYFNFVFQTIRSGGSLVSIIRRDS